MKAIRSRLQTPRKRDWQQRGLRHEDDGDVDVGCRLWIASDHSVDSDGLNDTAMTITCSCDDMPMLVWHGDDDHTLLRQWANDSGDSDVDVAIWRW